jgi:hypothetical protein
LATEENDDNESQVSAAEDDDEEESQVSTVEEDEERGKLLKSTSGDKMIDSPEALQQDAQMTRFDSENSFHGFSDQEIGFEGSKKREEESVDKMIEVTADKGGQGDFTGIDLGINDSSGEEQGEDDIQNLKLVLSQTQDMTALPDGQGMLVDEILDDAEPPDLERHISEDLLARSDWSEAVDRYMPLSRTSSFSSTTEAGNKTVGERIKEFEKEKEEKDVTKDKKTE